MGERMAAVLAAPWFQRGIIGVILLNAALLGLMTVQGLDPTTVAWLHGLDMACLLVFVVELLLKLAVQRLAFFRSGWNVFDLGVVLIALAPATGPLSVLRTLRVFRLMRLVTMIPAMRQVISGMVGAIPGAASVLGVLLVIFYVAAIMAHDLFGAVDSEHFGEFGGTIFTLFQMMTLEGWPDIARGVMEKLPYAWLFFVPFIIATTFTTLNLMFGIIVDSMERAKEEAAEQALADRGTPVPSESDAVRVAMIEAEVQLLANELSQLQQRLLQTQGGR